MTELSEAVRSVAPVEAQYVLLSSVARIVSGGTPKTGEASNWNGSIPWATPKDLSGLNSAEIHSTPRLITEAGLRNSSAELLPVNSVLFSSRAPIGLLAINTTPMATNQGFKSFVPDPEKLDSRYLFRWLEANRTTLQNMGVGATFKEVSKAIVARLVIPLPSLNQQRRIAAVLDKADELRAKRKEALESLDALTQGIFREMFGDPRPSKSEYGHALMGAVCSKITDGTHHSPPIQETGIPYITAKHLKSSGLEFFSNPWYVSETDHAAIYARCDPKRGDVLYIKDGATTGLAAVNDYDFPFSMLSSLALLRPGPALTATYLAAWLNSPIVKNDLIREMAGAAITRFTLTKIKNFRIPVPPIGIQEEFGIRICALELLKKRSRVQLAELDSLFASLQQRAFNGEL